LYDEVERGKPYSSKVTAKTVAVVAEQNNNVSAEVESPTMKELKRHY
jgi:hypothetical protein